MKMSIPTVVLVSASLCCIAGDAAKSSDHANIQGVWLAESESQNGHKRPVNYEYVFRGDKITFKDETGKETKYSFQLDTANKPKLITIREEGTITNAAPVSVAYELRRKSLKIVVAQAGSRPTEISDKNNQELIVCRRKSP